MKYLTVYLCPDHRTGFSLCLDDTLSGRRLLGGKCCLRQYEEKLVSWALPDDKIDQVIEALVLAKGEPHP